MISDKGTMYFGLEFKGGLCKSNEKSSELHFSLLKHVFVDSAIALFVKIKQDFTVSCPVYDL